MNNVVQSNTTDIDDEYGNVGLYDPKICITTSRDPSSKLKQFIKEIKLCIPNAQNINRGNYRIDELVNSCKKSNFNDIIILNETRGVPDAMIISHLPYGPTAYFTLSNVVMRHDIAGTKKAAQEYPHLVLDGMTSKIGERVARIFQSLYPVPKIASQRVVTYAHRDSYISFRHHTYAMDKGHPHLEEVGPRFELIPYEIRLGTVDQEDAEKEWTLHLHINSKKRNILS